ncbi:hypothetical protein [Mucilaginibacter sp. PAMB04168]
MHGNVVLGNNVKIGPHALLLKDIYPDQTIIGL